MTSSEITQYRRSGEFDFSAFDNFSAAGQAVLAHLRGQLGFSLWTLNRVDGDDWIVLQSIDNGVGVYRGDVFRYAETFCSRMVAGLGPNIAGRISDVPAYATAEQAKRLNVAAYIGVPIYLDSGTLFGTIAAFDRAEHSSDLNLDLPVVRLLARMLGSLVSRELRDEESARRTERSSLESDVDVLTGIGNRDLWDRMLDAEEERCARYGHHSCVISVDIDDLAGINADEGFERGDDVLVKAAAAMRNSVRANDVVARIGDDDFAILAVECDDRSGARLVRRLERAFAERGVKATLGLAGRDPSKGLEPAWHEAMRAMIDRKRSRRARRGA